MRFRRIDRDMPDDLVQRLPKAELHVHLEGAMRPHLLLELARKRRVSLPANDEAGLERWFRFRDFEHFVEIYLACSKCLRDPEDFQLLLEDFIDQQAMQNVVYSEVHFTISTHLTNGANGAEVADALGETIEQGERRGIVVRLIPDIVRNIDPAHADRTIEWALDHRRKGVVALGLAGIEGYPVGPFARHFEAAREAGLNTTAHAGEQLGPDSIREVLDACRPERLGHGIQATADPSLLDELVGREIPLEVCPTSNVCLGYAPSLAEHPFDRLLAAGARLSVNSDDPPLFGTSLVEEYRSLATAFGYSDSQIADLARAAFEQAFLDEPTRRQYLAAFDTELSAAR